MGATNALFLCFICEHARQTKRKRGYSKSKKKSIHADILGVNARKTEVVATSAILRRLYRKNLHELTDFGDGKRSPKFTFLKLQKLSDLFQNVPRGSVCFIISVGNLQTLYTTYVRVLLKHLLTTHNSRKTFKR